MGGRPCGASRRSCNNGLANALFRWHKVAMIKPLISLASALALSAPLAAQDAALSSSSAVGQTETSAPSPNETVAGAAPDDWVRIAPDYTRGLDRKGNRMNSNQ